LESFLSLSHDFDVFVLFDFVFELVSYSFIIISSAAFSSFAESFFYTLLIGVEAGVF